MTWNHGKAKPNSRMRERGKKDEEKKMKENVDASTPNPTILPYVYISVPHILKNATKPNQTPLTFHPDQNRNLR